MNNKLLKSIFVGILVILSAISIVCAFLYAENIMETFIAVLCLTILLVQIFYVLKDYKKPHGNSFRISVVLFSWVFMIACFTVMHFYYDQMPASAYLLGSAAMATSYAAGRLNKFISSSVLMAIACVLGIADLIYTVNVFKTSLLDMLAFCSIDIHWLTTMAIYHFRYNKHTTA